MFINGILGKVSEEQLDKWCKEIDEEEQRKEQESMAHAQWLKEREIRKQEIERAWRPVKPAIPATGQKRKNSDSNDTMTEAEQSEDSNSTPQENPKSSLSPLLTCLLKSPSQAQNVATSSILHSAITSQRATNSNNTSPMIASLLNSATTSAVTPGIQQLVTTAIGQEQVSSAEEQNQPLGNDILDDAQLSNIKIDDLASSILVQDGPLPEIKKEEVDDIISEIIENAQDIVADPEQHLQLDGNGDININLELDDFEEEEAQLAAQEAENKDKQTESTKPNIVEKIQPSIDPFEFQEDPVIFEPPKPSTANKEPKHLPHYQQQLSVSEQVKDIVQDIISEVDHKTEKEIKQEALDELPKLEKAPVPGSIDVVEVIVDDDENQKDAEPPQLEESVKIDKEEIENIPKIESKEDTTKTSAVKVEDNKEVNLIEDSSSSDRDIKKFEIKKELTINLDVEENIKPTTITPDFTEELYDDVSMEVKVDKTGKAKRDYSRTKKKEDKSFDVLLSIEKTDYDDDFGEEILSDKELMDDKKDVKTKLKAENDRSNSPWTEEEDNLSTSRSKRRYSTPATPSDSVPNSPASSVVFCDDDRDYRNWKKSVMLVYNRLATNKYASLFLKPITEDQAPGYNNIVYRPMDLQTIKKNIESGAIRTTLEFKRDILLMFNNAIMYNKTNGTIYNMAKQMQQESLQPIEILMQAQSSHSDVPVRRETRTSESGCKRKRTITGSEDVGKNKKRKDD